MRFSFTFLLSLIIYILGKPNGCEAGLLETIAKAVGTYFKVFYPEVTTPRKDYSPDFELQDQLVVQSQELMRDLVNIKNNITQIEDNWAGIQEFAELRRNPKNIFAENTLGIVDNLSEVISKMSLSSAFKNMEAPIVFLEPPSVAIKQEEVAGSPCFTCAGRLSLSNSEFRIFKTEIKRLKRIHAKTLQEANEELLETENLAKEFLQQKEKIIENIQKLSGVISLNDGTYGADNVELKFLRSDLAIAEQKHAALTQKKKALEKKIEELSSKKKSGFWRK
ncbi:putative secreted protein, signal peptide [Cryptosporidium felis]|nr:putative secreted protein, signal peptide [Cryptosporidium felis]